MSKELSVIADNNIQPSPWVRLLFMAGFVIASYFVLLPVILVLSIVQSLFTLITGQSNANLRHFSATLALYVTQVIGFLTYLSEVKPYPFSDFPGLEGDSLQEDSTPKSAKKQASKKTSGAEKGESKASAIATAKKKPATVKKKPAKVKKKAVRKKAVKKKATKSAPKTVPKTVPKTAEKPVTDATSEGASDS